MPPPIVNGTNTSSAVRRARSTIVSRLPDVAVMSRNTTSSAPSASYFSASSTGSPASRRSTKFVPLTTRPASTSRHGITRSRCTASAYECGLGLADGEALLVERLAHDHPAEVDLPQLGERRQVLELADPAAVEEPPAHDRCDALDLGEVGALEHAVLVDVGVDERAHPTLLQPADDRVGGHLGRLRPARRGDVSAARVDRDDEAVAERAEDVVEEVDVVVGGGAEDHPLGPGPQRVANGRQLAQPTAVLHRDRQLVGDPLEMLEVHRAALTRAVEVDDVEEASALVDPRARRFQRIVLVDGLGVEVPPHEAHRLAVGDVDRRIEDHAATGTQSRVNSRNNRSPAWDDFSGWN